jgi:hypothetical protein
MRAFAAVVLLGSGLGCRETCNLYHGSEDGRADGKDCKALASYQCHCPHESGSGGDYVSGYRIGFCEEASDTCVSASAAARYVCQNGELSCKTTPVDEGAVDDTAGE